MTTILNLYLIAGLLLIGLSIPLILKKVKPNALYGFRLQQTLDDPQVWYAVNAYSGKWLLVAGIATIVAAIGFYLIPGISLDAYALACLGVVGTLLVIGFVQSIRYLNKLVKS
jgi:uncharacterized membrane protein